MTKKTVARVDKEGLFVEDTIVDNPNGGVTEIVGKTNEVEGYHVDVPVPSNLFRPKWLFDLGQWVEGLAASIIRRLTRQPEPTPSETDILAEQLIEHDFAQMEQSRKIKELQKKLADAEETNVFLGQQVVEQSLANADLKKTTVSLQETNDLLGQQLVEQDLVNADLKKTTVSLQETNDLLGQQLVEQDLANIMLHAQVKNLQTTNDLLGSQVVAQDLANVELTKIVGSLEQNNLALGQQLVQQDLSNVQLNQAVAELKDINLIMGEQLVEGDLAKSEMKRALTEVEKTNNEVKADNELLGQRIVVLELSLLNNQTKEEISND